MDDAMQEDPLLTPSRSRKRTSNVLDDSSDDDNDISITDTPSKRLRDRQGNAVQQEGIRYKAQDLLNDLAFSRLYVTANYHRYNPATSPIILCVLSNHDSLYRALCQALPSLYCIAPNLQAIAVAPDQGSQFDPSQVIDAPLLRILPIVSQAELDPKIIDRLETFRQSLPHPQNFVALVAPNRDCCWTSAELSYCPGVDFSSAKRAFLSLESALTQHLANISPCDAMDEGV